jgi:hypothetical protein
MANWQNARAKVQLDSVGCEEEEWRGKAMSRCFSLSSVWLPGAGAVRACPLLFAWLAQYRTVLYGTVLCCTFWPGFLPGWTAINGCVSRQSFGEHRRRRVFVSVSRY